MSAAVGGVALAWLMAGAVGVPLLLALAWWIPPLRRGATALAPFGALPALLLAGLHHAGAVGEAATGAAGEGGGATLELTALSLGLRFGVDLEGGVFLVLTAVLWVLAGIFARSYHADDARRGSFFAFFSATLAGNVGLVLAGDLLTFYLFFTLMTFAGWGLVVHARSGEAMRAGRVYMALALLGEVAILCALFALGAAGGAGFTDAGFVEAGLDTALVPGQGLAQSWEALGPRAPLVMLLAMFGLGVKAGLLPVHLWLPLAHPVAPTAASALLSGVMIKAGLLGWLRILPEGALAEAALSNGLAGGLAGGPGIGAGEVLMAVGVLGAFWGVVCGLAQDDPKTILAYSSISQMGYMALGAGLLLLAGPDTPVGAAALGAVLLYALHHGVAKGTLFLAVGVADHIPTAPGRSATFWRWTLRGGVLLPSLALAGLPLTSGALSKGALKGVLGEHGGTWYAVLDPLLLVAAFGTTLLLARFWVRLEARVERREEEEAGEEAGKEAGAPAPGMAGSWLALVALGVAAPLWLGWPTFSPSGMALPGPLDDALSLAMPVILGVAASAWVRYRMRRKGALPLQMDRLRIPAGDLLVPVVALLRRRPRTASLLASAATRLEHVADGAESGVVGLHRRLERGDLILTRGPVLGALLLVLVVLLALAGSGGAASP